MLTSTGRYQVRPEWADRWLGLVDEFTRDCRAADGTLNPAGNGWVSPSLEPAARRRPS